MRLVYQFTFLHWHLTTFLTFYRLANFFRDILAFFSIFCAANLVLDIVAFLFVNRTTLLLRLLIIAIFIRFFHLHRFGWSFLTFLTNFCAISSCDGFVNRFARSFRFLFAFTLRNLKFRIIRTKLDQYLNFYLYISALIQVCIFTPLHWLFDALFHITAFLFRDIFASLFICGSASSPRDATLVNKKSIN